MEKQNGGGISITYDQLEKAIKEGELDKLLKPVSDRLARGINGGTRQSLNVEQEKCQKS